MIRPPIALVFIAASAAGLLRDLSDPSYPVRQRASAELWARGESARLDLERLAAGPNPEAAGRSRAILARFNLADYPGVQPEAAEAVRLFRTGDPNTRRTATRQLLDLGAAGRRVLKPLLARHVPTDDRSAFFTRFAQLTRRDIPLLLFAHEPIGATELAALAAKTPGFDGPADLALLHLSLGDPSAAQAPAQGDPVAEAFAAYVAGDKPAAIAAARRAEATDYAAHVRLVDALLEDAGEWGKLLNRPEGQTNCPDGLRAYRLIRAGRLAEADTLLDQMGRNPPGPPTRPTELDRDALGLFLNGRTDLAIARLERFERNRQVVADVKLARLDWAGSLMAARDVRATDEGGTSYGEANRILAASRRGRVLCLMGETAAGDAAFEEGARIAAEMKYSREWFKELLEMEIHAGRRALAVKHLDVSLAREAARGDQGDTASNDHVEAVFSDDWEEARVLLDALELRNPDDLPLGSPVATVDRMLDGRATAEELAAVERLVMSGREGEAKRSGALALSAVYREHARPADALRGMLAAAGPADAPAPVEPPTGEARLGTGRLFGTDEGFVFWVELADLLLSAGRADESATRALQGWRYDPNNPILLTLAAHAKRVAGDRDEAERLTKLAHQAPLGNVRTRGRYLDFLVNRGFLNAGAREAELTQALAWIPEPNAGNAWSRVRKVAVRRPGSATLAAESNRRITSHILKTPGYGFIDGTAYAAVPGALSGFLALQAAQARDFPTAKRYGEELLRRLPGDTDELGPVVRELDAAGQPQIAESLFRMGWADHQKCLKLYPKSSAAQTSAAEYASACRRELPAALVLAKRGVELDPTGDLPREVLAECHFRLGDRNAALAVVAKLITENPRSFYYPRLVPFYRSGDPNARLPAAD